MDIVKSKADDFGNKAAVFKGGLSFAGALIVLAAVFVGPVNAAEKSEKGEVFNFASSDGESARVRVSSSKSSITVTFIEDNFDLPKHLEFSFVDKGGVRRNVQMGTISDRIVDRPSYSGENRSKQEAFAGIEIRIPLAKGQKVLKTVQP